MKAQKKSAAIVTINAPGKMTKTGRKAIADWLRRTATDLYKLGDRYTETRFTARYLYK
jgi:hypothetical protein